MPVDILYSSEQERDLVIVVHDNRGMYDQIKAFIKVGSLTT